MAPFKFILALGGICVAAYLLFFWWQSGKVPQTIDISKADSFKSVPATVCTLANNNSSLSGMLYVFHDAARFDITSAITGSPISVHIMVSREDSAYYWVDGEKKGAKGDYGPVYKNVGLSAITKIDCKPWWFPNGTSFIVPQDVSFK